MLLTEGAASVVSAKTAYSLLRYLPDEVVAVLDSARAGKTAQEFLAVGGDTPCVASLGDAPPADTLLVGIAPPGGKLPESWRPILLEAIRRGMRIVSGLHDFVSDDPVYAQAAAEAGVEIIDVRKNNEKEIGRGEPLPDTPLRVLTIGGDCSVGKMLTAYELTAGLKQAGVDAKFIATGQTGIMIEGDGCPIDCVVSDFVNGAVERMMRAHGDRQVLVVEGQASIAHPAYSAVSAGLLHGSRPHGMVLVYEAGRTHHFGLDHAPLAPLPEVVAAYENLAALRQPAKVIAVAMNSRRLNDDQVEPERERVAAELGVPVCDPVRDGSATLVEAVQRLREEVSAAAN